MEIIRYHYCRGGWYFTECDFGESESKTKWHFHSEVLTLQFRISGCVLRCVQLFSTPWTAQAPLSIGFSRQEYWSGWVCPPPGDLPDQGIEPRSPLCASGPSRFSHVWLFATPWIAVCQVPLSMGFSRQDYWSGLPCLPPGDLPNPGLEPASLTSPALAGVLYHEHYLGSVAYTMCVGVGIQSLQSLRSHVCKMGVTVLVST